MIPLSLVTGFLGAGKTTFLKHTAEKNPQSRIVYLVNEFSPEDLDGIQLEGDSEHIISVPGGSIFCRCLAGTFIQHLTDIPKQLHMPGNPVQGVLIEASGTADPSVLTHMLKESGMDRIYELRRILCVIDPGSLHKLLHTLPNIQSQIEAAGTILINKTDQYSENELETTEQKLSSLAPQAELIRTVYSETEIDLFQSVRHTPAESSEYALCKDPNYEQLLVECTEPVTPEWLTSQLKAFGSEIYRAKGDFLAQGQSRKWLEHTASGTLIKDVDSPSRDRAPRLTFILRNGVGEKFRTIAEKLGEVVVHA